MRFYPELKIHPADLRDAGLEAVDTVLSLLDSNIFKNCTS